MQRSSVSTFPSRGLYAVTDRALSAREGLESAVEQALLGGARVVQYRDKSETVERRREEALRLRDLCREAGVPLIINDDVALAQAVQADGVHLGKDDPEIRAAREALGRNAVIGVSCYNRLELAERAVEQGADYVAFGRFFSSSTKPEAVAAEPSLLRLAKERLTVPVVAIGGITPENGGELIEAGADLLAVVSGLFGQSDVRLACTRMDRLFHPQQEFRS